MASLDHVPDLEDSEESLIRTHDGGDDNAELFQPETVLSHRFREPALHAQNRLQDKAKSKRIEVIVPAPSRPWEYLPFVESNTVENVLGETVKPNGETLYKIEYADGREEEVSI
jgi:chromodomain-helicase-DNA-binding protein 4